MSGFSPLTRAINGPNGKSDHPSTVRRQIISSTISQWAGRDVEGAANFVLTLSDGKERDRAVERLVYDVRRADPESAFDWAASIGDEQKREQMIRDTAYHWKRTDPDAARAAVESADIPDEARTRLLKHLE